MAYAVNFARCNLAVLMTILAALITCEARLMEKSIKAETKHPGILSSGSSITPSLAAESVIRHGTASKRIIDLETCSGYSSISIDNHAVPTAPGHAPAFQVQIYNLCNCPVSNLLLNCPNFASAELVDPYKFKALGDGTCLVMNGQAFPHGEAINFQYHQSFKNSLWFRSGTFGC